MKNVDAMGLSCPEPVIMAKRALKDSPDGIEIKVDNVASRENVSRYLEAMGLKVSVEEGRGDWRITGRR